MPSELFSQGTDHLSSSKLQLPQGSEDKGTFAQNGLSLGLSRIAWGNWALWSIKAGRQSLRSVLLVPALPQTSPGGLCEPLHPGCVWVCVISSSLKHKAVSDLFLAGEFLSDSQKQILSGATAMGLVTLIAVMWVYTCVKTYQTVCLKHMHFGICYPVSRIRE